MTKHVVAGTRMIKKQYKKRVDQFIVAVQINLDTEGFSYLKWGGEQSCRPGDWLVNNNGESYTIGNQSFLNTYKSVAPGQYVKTTPVWACQASEAGKLKTNEGYVEYLKGDYIVTNNSDGTDAYTVAGNAFDKMYEESTESIE